MEILSKNSFTACGKNFLIGGHDLAVKGVSKFKVDVIFFIFHELNIMLEIVDSYLFTITPKHVNK